MSESIDLTSQQPRAAPVVPNMMRAVTYDHYGRPENLPVAEVTPPWRLSGSVVIRVQAAGINLIDLRMRQGELRWLLPGDFPRIPGYDVAGEIVDVDPETGLDVGDRVEAVCSPRPRYVGPSETFRSRRVGVAVRCGPVTGDACGRAAARAGFAGSQAHRLLANGGHRGKSVLVCGD